MLHTVWDCEMIILRGDCENRSVPITGCFPLRGPGWIRSFPWAGATKHHSSYGKRMPSTHNNCTAIIGDCIITIPGPCAARVSRLLEPNINHCHSAINHTNMSDVLASCLPLLAIATSCHALVFLPSFP